MNSNAQESSPASTRKSAAQNAAHTVLAVGSRSSAAVFSVFDDFKNFIAKGNVVDLAVGIILGAAFSSIVTSMVTDLIAPIIALASPESALGTV